MEKCRFKPLVDKKKVIITDTSIRRDLQLTDENGTECLPNATIFAELERIGYENLTQKLTFYKASFHLNGNFLSIQFCNALVLRLLLGTNLVALWPLLSSVLATNQKFNFSREPIADEALNDENVPTHSNDPLLSGEERLKLNELMELYTNLSQRVLDLENTKTSQAAEITKLKERVKKLERRNKSRTPGLKRLRKVGRTARIESSEDEGLGDQEDASKQGRKITDIDADEEVTLIDETQGRNDDNLMFDTGVLDEQEVEVEKTLIEIKAAKPKAVTTAATTTTTDVTRPKARGVVVQEPSEFTTTTSPSQTSQLPQAKDKGKEKMVEPEKPLKNKIKF
ncbi:hypothetical protein Tco_1023759 [Tanacetum coccineum]